MVLGISQSLTNGNRIQLVNVPTSDVEKSVKVNELDKSLGPDRRYLFELVTRICSLIVDIVIERGAFVAGTSTQPHFTGLIHKVKPISEEHYCSCCSDTKQACGKIQILVSDFWEVEILKFPEVYFHCNVQGKQFTVNQYEHKGRLLSFSFWTCDKDFFETLVELKDNVEYVFLECNDKYEQTNPGQRLYVLLFKDVTNKTKVIIKTGKETSMHHMEDIKAIFGSEGYIPALRLTLGCYAQKQGEDLNIKYKRSNTWSSGTTDESSQPLNPIRTSGLSYERIDLVRKQYEPNIRDFIRKTGSVESRVQNLPPLKMEDPIRDSERSLCIHIVIRSKWFSIGLSACAVIMGFSALVINVRKMTQEQTVSSVEKKDFPLFNDSIIQLLHEKKRQLNLHRLHSLKRSPASAHISLALPPRIPGSEDKQDPYFKKDYNVCVRTKTTSNSNVHARGVIVDIDGLVIMYSGLYFVYSGVSFKPNSTDFSATFAYQTWFQYIYKMRPNSPAHSTVLTRVVHTCCLNCTNSQNTAYSGGAFYLETGDMLQ
ncbi:tumor necrosis factor ligand superfamily member 6, partial [Biomphalaria pfeifferi]